MEIQYFYQHLGQCIAYGIRGAIMVTIRNHSTLIRYGVVPEWELGGAGAEWKKNMPNNPRSASLQSPVCQSAPARWAKALPYKVRGEMSILPSTTDGQTDRQIDRQGNGQTAAAHLHPDTDRYKVDGLWMVDVVDYLMY